MSNCTKCNKEITDTEHTLYNTYCQNCWPSIPRSERKKLPDFCSNCGHSTFVVDDGLNGKGIICGMCGHLKIGYEQCVK